jgi:ATP-dependent helicase HrpA
MPRPRPTPSFRIEFPPELPICARADEIIGLLQKHQVLVLAGETGSGKTTQIPKMVLAAGGGTRGQIACTQPRRVAAALVSRRVAEELNVAWGREVGCKIRFADQTTPDTVIKFMTDGMLLAELQGDPELRDYDTIIVDEAHERSLNIDFILGHLRRLRLRRPDLRIVITSATIDTKAFSEAFDGAPIVEVSGRTYPVEVIWSPLEEMVGAVAPNGPSEQPRALEGKRPYPSRQSDEFTYIDGAVEAVRRILDESANGDILIFLPTERDIREVTDLLEGSAKSAIRSRQSAIEVVPLFGRLTNTEQQRVFAPTPRRKVVVATNIAETSLTIPGIRFVIDTGLARISRYVPQSRTRRLPVEPVAQSSADQRKGRCGRVSNGVCIRLFGEQDFNDRPRFAQPEIQRSNLADVILRMKAFGLGDIEDFPFLNAPPAKGIRAGYALLEELGAIVPCRAGSPDPAAKAKAPEDRRGSATPPYIWELTELGRELAHLPVDPTIGRMILQARQEKAVREVLVIAAALSIQDPRERPLDQQAKADAAHRRFTHPDSDFLTLLAIWEAYHDEFEAMTLGKLRKFCAAHFLSFMRMREWRDVHAQLVDTIEGREGFADTSVFDGCGPGLAPDKKGTVGAGLSRDERRQSGSKARPTKTSPAEVRDLQFGTPGYRAVHRAILTGLLGNIAVRDDEGAYRATHDRKVAVFPGSGLAEKQKTNKPTFAKASAVAEAKADKPEGTLPNAKRSAKWLMAAEVMETGRIYARTCARIDPAWAVEMGAHLIKASHSEPFWSPEAGRVLVKERRRLYNLELETKSVGYGKIDPRHATEIFLREGLVGDTITWPFDFLAHNRRLREQTEAVLTRTRSAGHLSIDETMYGFYAARLLPEGRASSPNEPNRLRHFAARSENSPYLGVSSVPELIDLVRHRQMTEPKFLFMAEADLRPPAELAEAAAEFPAELPLENRALPLDYAYKPGQDDDGVTLRVTAVEAGRLTAAALDWAVPGHLREKVELLLKSLPKEQRRALIPLADTAREIAEELGRANRLGEPRLGEDASPYQRTLVEALAELLTVRLGARVDARHFAADAVPAHLRVRVAVVDAQGRELGASRDLNDLKKLLGQKHHEIAKRAAGTDSATWRAARAKWETPPVLEWKFGDVPESVPVEDRGGVATRAYPGLAAMPAGVAVRLFASSEEARRATAAGVAKLLESQLRHDLGWLEKDLRDLRALGPLAATLASLASLQADAFESIKRWATDAGRVGAVGPNGPPATETRVVEGNRPYLTQAMFERAVATAKADLRGLVPKLGDLLQEILEMRLALQTHKTPYPGMENDLAGLLPADFVRRTSFARLKDLPRYLRAMQMRADRWKRDQAKDGARARELQPFVAAVKRLEKRAGGEAPAAGWEDFRWLVEEFRVSLFAQELGTAEPVSAVRLERALRDLVAGAAGANTTALKMTSPVALPTQGKTVLKSLDALGRLKG